MRLEVLALSRLLHQFGPQLGRPRVDTLKASSHSNMKELRFNAAGGEWRVAFAFNTKRRELLRKADDRFNAHLCAIKKEKELNNGCQCEQNN